MKANSTLYLILYLISLITISILWLVDSDSIVMLSSSYVSDLICSLSTCFFSFSITKLKKFLMGLKSGEHGVILNIMAPISSNAFCASFALCSGQPSTGWFEIRISAIL